MDTSTFSRGVGRLGLLVSSLLAASPGSATQPLFDMYTDGARTGKIFPAECCYLALPENERIRELRRQEMGKCSAMGGPAGRFKREAGTLWLIGLFKCSGDIDLQEVYPAMKAPVVADWLTGRFTTVLEFRCIDGTGRYVYGLTQQLTVDHGIIVASTDTSNEATGCAR